jgi:3-oxoacyl-ACP reductase-like protein
MAMNETMGEPIPRGIIGDSAPIADESYGSDKRTVEQEAQLAEIKEEVRQLRHTIAQLAETTTKYTQKSIQNAAQTAVDRYPVGSVVLAALIGYWFAGRRH